MDPKEGTQSSEKTKEKEKNPSPTKPNNGIPINSIQTKKEDEASVEPVGSQEGESPHVPDGKGQVATLSEKLLGNKECKSINSIQTKEEEEASVEPVGSQEGESPHVPDEKRQVATLSEKLLDKKKCKSIDSILTKKGKEASVKPVGSQEDESPHIPDEKGQVATLSLSERLLGKKKEEASVEHVGSQEGESPHVPDEKGQVATLSLSKKPLGKKESKSIDGIPNEKEEEASVEPVGSQEGESPHVPDGKGQVATLSLSEKLLGKKRSKSIDSIPTKNEKEESVEPVGSQEGESPHVPDEKSQVATLSLSEKLLGKNEFKSIDSIPPKTEEESRVQEFEATVCEEFSGNKETSPIPSEEVQQSTVQDPNSTP